MPHTKTIGTLKRPLTDILYDLAQPVPPEMIQQKPVYTRGQRSGFVNYIPWHNYIYLLLKYAPGYSWEIRTKMLGDRVVVEGRLTISAQEGDFVYESPGVAHVEDTNYGDAIYDAEASAIRRSMSKVGCAIELWGRESSDYPQATPAPQREIRKVTQSQLTRLYAIVNNLGMSKTRAKEILLANGYSSSKDILFDDYERIVDEMKKATSVA